MVAKPACETVFFKKTGEK